MHPLRSKLVNALAALITSGSLVGMGFAVNAAITPSMAYATPDLNCKSGQDTTCKPNKAEWAFYCIGGQEAINQGKARQADLPVWCVPSKDPYKQ
jgi:hypothetical protein